MKNVKRVTKIRRLARKRGLLFLAPFGREDDFFCEVEDRGVFTVVLLDFGLERLLGVLCVVDFLDTEDLDLLADCFFFGLEVLMP